MKREGRFLLLLCILAFLAFCLFSCKKKKDEETFFPERILKYAPRNTPNVDSTKFSPWGK